MRSNLSQTLEQHDRGVSKFRVLLTMLVILVEAPRGLFYSPKWLSSRCSLLWKLKIAFCPRVHRTVRCTPDSFGCNGHQIRWLVVFHFRWAPYCPVVHRTVWWPLPTVGALTWLVSRPLHRLETHWSSRTSDCPVIFSQRARQKPKNGQLTWSGTGLCGAARTDQQRLELLSRTSNCPVIFILSSPHIWQTHKYSLNHNSCYSF
jgi:hypothetical protein